jgi:competence ComEA-like helix-hairpin-helix protein
MGDVTDTEMLKVEIALRKVLGLPLKIDNIEKVNKPESERIAELEMELSIHKKLYEKAVEKIVELKFEKDCSGGVIETRKSVVEEVEVPQPELDLSGLSENYDECEKMSDEEVAATLEQAGMKKHAEESSRRGPGGRAKLDPNAKTINVNTATLADFKSVGLGEITAKNIVTWRKKHGPFISLEDMLLVPRFGKGCLRTFESVLEV